MKNLFKVTGLCAAVLMAGSAAAADETAEQSFQWVGTVPAKAISTGALSIENAGPIGFSDGQLVFKELDNGKYQLNTASDMTYHITDTANTGDTFTNVTYEVSRIQYSTNGSGMKLVNSADPEFIATVDGAEIAQDTSFSAVVDKDSRLSFQSAELDLVPEDTVVLQATLLVAYDIG